MAECTMRFCSLCDPSSIPAIEYCTDCDEFLCIDCVKPHQTSKHLKTHSRLSVENYEKLPSFVRELQLICQEHDEKLDSFCPVHNIPCCLRCAFESHKTCEGVIPLKDCITHSKDSPIITDLEQTVDDVLKFVEKAITDRSVKKDMITTQKETIISEIKTAKAVVISRLDDLEKNIYENLDVKSNEICHDIDIFIEQLKVASAKLVEMKEECRVIVNCASVLQTFLSLSVLMSSVVEKEEEVQRLWKDERPCSMNLSFQADDFPTNVSSIGMIKTTNEEKKIQYTNSKEKQAQIQGLITPNINRSISQIKLLTLDLNNRYNIISGCDISKNGNMVIAEYNKNDFKDRVSVYDMDGSFLRSLTKRKVGSLYDVTVMDSERIAVTSHINFSYLCILGPTDSNNLKEMKTSDNIALCGVAMGNTDFIYVMEEDQGINRYNTKTRETCIPFVCDKGVERFSYVAYSKGKLVYTMGKNHTVVKCCDADSGNLLWTFENTNLLHAPRALAVDRDGFIYVVGRNSNNIVIITEDGTKAKELVSCSQPTALCYIGHSHQLLVCDKRNRATIYQISEK